MTQDAAMLAFDVRGLTKTFGKRVAVDHVDLSMPKGEVWGFLGPNGSGKTTTIRMLCGLLSPDDGDGECFGFNIRTQAREIKRRVGYMTQKFSYWQDLTIRENLEFVARLYEIEDAKALVDQTLEQLGLASRQDQLAGSLSGGWKQRLALAACTMHKPELLLLDEPTAGVDPQARRDFWDQIHRLASSGLTVLVSTHYMDEAERCDRIVYLAYGKIMAQGTVAEIVDGSGLHTYVAEGDGVRKLADNLRGQDGVEHVAYFGAALHISGRDPAKLNAAIAPYRSDANLQWRAERPSLEDVFIELMAQSQERNT
jgi:ABC-2 type transport system ATP-binding protein